eukprot:579224-Pyramimonas_sp.AAC.1
MPPAPPPPRPAMPDRLAWRRAQPRAVVRIVANFVRWNSLGLGICPMPRRCHPPRRPARLAAQAACQRPLVCKHCPSASRHVTELVWPLMLATAGDQVCPLWPPSRYTQPQADMSDVRRSLFCEGLPLSDWHMLAATCVT